MTTQLCNQSLNKFYYLLILALMGNAAKAYRIETERLVIRCYKPADAPLLKLAIDASLAELIQWMPWAKNEPETVEQKTQRLRHFRAMFDLDQDYNYGIFNKTETELIGSTGLHTRVGADAREIGYWINSKHTGKGYAQEAAAALTKTGFEIDGLERIEIHCDPKNYKSSKIPAALGYQHEATLRNRLKNAEGQPRDKMIWTLFKADYEQSRLKQLTIKVFNESDIQSL